jgi:hypothetical protein
MAPLNVGIAIVVCTFVHSPHVKCRVDAAPEACFRPELERPRAPPLRPLCATQALPAVTRISATRCVAPLRRLKETARALA